MEPRITRAEAAMLLPLPLPRSTEAMKVEAVIAAARRDRDAAITAGILGFFRSLREGLTLLRTRRETIERLRNLDDRQLSDIGVLRGNIGLAANDMAETRRAA